MFALLKPLRLIVCLLLVGILSPAQRLPAEDTLQAPNPKVKASTTAPVDAGQPAMHSRTPNAQLLVLPLVLFLTLLRPLNLLNGGRSCYNQVRTWPAGGYRETWYREEDGLNEGSGECGMQLENSGASGAW